MSVKFKKLSKYINDHRMSNLSYITHRGALRGTEYHAGGQWSAGLSFHQGVGGSIPALVDLSLSKTLNPDLLPVAVSTVYKCNMSVSCFG